MLAPNLETSQRTAASQKTSKTSEKPSDNWYTPQHIIDLVIQVLNQIDLDPCAETGKNIPASTHYTHTDNGLIQPWHGRIFLNPPYSEPGKWITKLNEEIATGRVTEAIALVPGATDTNWLSPILKTQPVCFWKGRIKFLDQNYEPKLPARQSHVLIYWGDNSTRFLEIFDAYGVVQLPQAILSKLLKTSPSNTYEIFPGDKQDTNISPRKIEAPQPQFPEPSQNCHSERSEESTISQNLREAPKFLGDKSDTNISPRKIEAPKFLGDNSDINISSRKIEAPQFLGDKSDTNCHSTNSEESTISQDLRDAPKFLGDNSDTNISPRKRRRHKGDGSGSIHWRTVTKKGKDYHEAYYHYEFWSDGEREVKSTKYIPKRLLSQVQSLDLEKAPVREILEVLGVL
ncbi:hypothetical protein DSM106972_092740 [Dulcicalothrix desertica PCC 7102]|uniref:C-5 cytosine-specific DNA methylase n=1 Tax=Dulcicalothrix desertica PCC 7102 TaxID=232991 RepID=A0A3S1A732_9CYAN|nr:DNA N-6-adenine-methyltransferase [Dulcicalothrix desertica]RUS94637.1 hypothetical protein DSM106972_092740 [Dulcicalothrix desertica PCC 7102]TWH62530.1 phage N-6-adenine-methyltransferase [Dulcicalothrix desertica PCC 7102]